MTELGTLLPWAALWALLTFAGQFIDKYHVRQNWQTVVQARLVALFPFLEAVPERLFSGSRVEKTSGPAGRAGQGAASDRAFNANKPMQRTGLRPASHRQHLGGQESDPKWRPTEQGSTTSNVGSKKSGRIHA